MAFLGLAALARPRMIPRTARLVCARACYGAQNGGDPGLRGMALLRSDLQRFSRLMCTTTGNASVTSSASIDTHFPTYDPVRIAEYFDRRPVEAGARLARVAVPFGLWLLRVRYLDKVLFRTPPTERRADQLRRLLTWAGPIYLKIGQAIGNRPDIIGVVYSAALQRLVDDVGAFDSDTAMQILRDELGVTDHHEVFSEFGVEPVASASLGQVHRARLHTGEELAVKIQRPEVRLTAPIDLYCLRRTASFLKQRFKLRSNLVGIVDEFGARLWEELNYQSEANNGDKFRDLYASEDIYVPAVHRNLTTARVLTAEWIDGDKPPWMPRDEALRLINIGVRCSLRQLLEKGLLHADPHVGNLLRRRSDGRLVYLDFGMCVEVPRETRETLIASIVRLINRDYENLAVDFIKLGFLPEGTDLAPVVPLLERAFGTASDTGGVSDLSFGKLASNLTELALNTPVRIPVFFTLIIRSLTILEGIALQTDPNFKIVDQSYPFVVERVLTDDAPVLQNALRNVLLDSNGRIRWSRLRTIASGISNDNSTESPSESVRTRRNENDGEVSGAALERLLDFTLSERGTFFRDALTLEVVDIVDNVQLALAHRAHQLSRGLLPKPPEKFSAERVELGLRVADAIRRRGPALLSGRGVEERRGRITQLAEQTVRVVLADIADRNTRRLLRSLANAVLGERNAR